MNRKLLHFAIFLLIIFGTSIVFYLCYNKIFTSDANLLVQNTFIDQNYNKNPTLDIITTRLAFISDTHENYELFNSLRESLKSNAPNLLIHTGDLTDYGTTDSLSIAQKNLNSLGFNYFAIPGDHDIAQTSSDINFKKFFDFPLTFKLGEFNFLIIPNYYNFTPLSDNLLNLILSSIPESDIIITSQPIYVDPSNIFADKYMGSKTAFENLTPDQVKNLKTYTEQKDQILKVIRSSSTTKIVISGDHHRSSKFEDPINKLVSYHVVGSLSKYIFFGNTKILQSSLQSNRYSILELGQKAENKFNFNITEIEIK